MRQQQKKLEDDALKIQQGSHSKNENCNLYPLAMKFNHPAVFSKIQLYLMLLQHTILLNLYSHPRPRLPSSLPLSSLLHIH